MSDDLHITNRLVIPSACISYETMRSGGPGGQHQNTTDSAVRLRLDLEGCSVLHPNVRARLTAAFPSQVTDGGELLVVARSERSQVRNKEEARERLADMIRAHLAPPKRRRNTKPTRASKRRRLDAKKHRGRIKGLRGKVDD